MYFQYLTFYACLRLRFLDVETNPGPRRPVPIVCRLLCSNVQGLAGNLSDLTMASFRFDILLCSETLVSDMCHVSEMLVSDMRHVSESPSLVLPGKDAYIRDGYGAFCQQKFECGCCEMLVFRVCGSRQNHS